MYKFNLIDASFEDIYDAVVRVCAIGAEYKSLKDMYFLWHPRTEYDFIKSYYNFAPRSQPKLSDVIAEIDGISIHSYCNRNAEEKELIVFI